MEQFVNHAAGLAGLGQSVSIDAVILRDDHEQGWDAAADSTLERRVYYAQNWRADVIALLGVNGRVLERVWYEAYGTPHGSPAADLTTSNTSANDDFGVHDGDADADDQSYYNTLHGASDARADLTGSTSSSDPDFGRPDGTVDSDDSTYYSALHAAAVDLGRGSLSGYSSATSLRNRKGLAGYEWDPSTSKYHVRNRVLDPETGRWTRRDPLGYVDGAGLYEYVSTLPLMSLDPHGLTNLSEPDCSRDCFQEYRRRESRALSGLAQCLNTNVLDPGVGIGVVGCFVACLDYFWSPPAYAACVAGCQIGVVITMGLNVRTCINQYNDDMLNAQNGYCSCLRWKERNCREQEVDMLGCTP